MIVRISPFVFGLQRRKMLLGRMMSPLACLATYQSVWKSSTVMLESTGVEPLGGHPYIMIMLPSDAISVALSGIGLLPLQGSPIALIIGLSKTTGFSSTNFSRQQSRTAKM